MNLTAGQMYDAFQALQQIARSRPRTIPQMAKFRLAKMYEILEPLFVQLDRLNDELVAELGEECFDKSQDPPVSSGWGVGPDSKNAAEYVRRWTEIRSQPMEINIKPISMTMLGDDPKGLEVAEFKLLGPFVVEDVVVC